MKRLVILILALLPFISSCKKDYESDPYFPIREIAWNAVGDQDKKTVTINWKQAPVSESTYNQKSVYAVEFKTDNMILGSIKVYVDKTSKVVIGFAGRL